MPNNDEIENRPHRGVGAPAPSAWLPRAEAQHAADVVLHASVAGLQPARGATRGGKPPQLERSAGGGVIPANGCIVFYPGAAVDLRVPHDLAVSPSAAPVEVSLRQFADTFSEVDTGAPGMARALRIPGGRHLNRWHARYSTNPEVTSGRTGA